jgi:hypothetical protein
VERISQTRVVGVQIQVSELRDDSVFMFIVLKCSLLKLSYLLNKSVLSCSGKCMMLKSSESD